MSKERKIEITGQDQPAIFANECHIMHTPNEFVLSIVEVIPRMEFSSHEITTSGSTKKITKLTPKGLTQKIVGRYGMSPAAFKKMVGIMNQNLKQYENKFGEIAIVSPEGMY